MVRSALFFLLVGFGLSGQLEAQPVQLLDDRGKPLVTPVEVCFQIALKQECDTLAPGRDVVLRESFQSLKIEGDDYGPVVARVSEMTDREVFQVPRKATLEFLRGDLPETATLYQPEEPDLRRPAHRLTVRSRNEIKVPAGEHLASLTRPGSAPDLHWIVLSPGERREVRFTPRPGWSLVLRAMNAETRAPVPDASVELRGAAGYSQAASTSRTARTNARGFALISGLSATMLEATVHRAGYVDREVYGLLSSPGTFAHQAVALETGGTVRITILQNGVPAPDARCEVVQYTGSPREGEPAARTVFQGTTDREGACRSRRLAPGPYVARAEIPASGAGTQRSIDVQSSTETALELDLVPIKVAGTVQVGTRPAKGFHVTVYNNEVPVRGRTDTEAPDTDVTDEEGKYDVTLWSKGTYGFLVRHVDGTPATSRFVDLEPGEEKVVDFQLDEAALAGRVVDTDGQPVPGAKVFLRWKKGGEGGAYSRLAVAAEDGSFSFLMEGTGAVLLQAHHDRYRSSEPVDAAFVAGVTPPPVKLVLTKEKTMRGIVTDATGIPVPRAMVATYASAVGGPPLRIGGTFTLADGSFEVERAESGAARGFVSGPGCPLTAFNVEPDEREARIVCPAAPSALALVVKDRSGRPLPGTQFILRRNLEVFPTAVVTSHLQMLRLPAETDGSGRLVLAGLAPGDYEVFFSSMTDEALAALGNGRGYLGAFTLAPMAATEIEVQLDTQLPQIQGPPR